MQMITVMNHRSILTRSLIVITLMAALVSSSTARA
ncbi:MAG: hypothetical protein QOF48_2485, partial [Verrucomicrobiota bacterium]